MDAQHAGYDPQRTLEKTLAAAGHLGFDAPENAIGFARQLGRNYEVLRQLLWAFRRGEQAFERRARIGMKFTAGFDHENHKAAIDQEGRSFELTADHFLRLLGAVDACCSPIYPIGSVAELDIEIMPEPARRAFTSKKKTPMLVCLTGRKLPLAPGFDGYIADYTGWIWPFGQIPGREPLIVASTMIKRVLSEGYSDGNEREFALKALRLPQLAARQISSAFMPEATAKDYLASLREPATPISGRC